MHHHLENFNSMAVSPTCHAVLCCYWLQAFSSGHIQRVNPSAALSSPCRNYRVSTPAGILLATVVPDA